MSTTAGTLLGPHEISGAIGMGRRGNRKSEFEFGGHP
jgi:hypothetical protein